MRQYLDRMAPGEEDKTMMKTTRRKLLALIPVVAGAQQVSKAEPVAAPVKPRLHWKRVEFTGFVDLSWFGGGRTGGEWIALRSDGVIFYLPVDAIRTKWVDSRIESFQDYEQIQKWQARVKLTSYLSWPSTGKKARDPDRVIDEQIRSWRSVTYGEYREKATAADLGYCRDAIEEQDRARYGEAIRREKV